MLGAIARVASPLDSSPRPHPFSPSSQGSDPVTLPRSETKISSLYEVLCGSHQQAMAATEGRSEIVALANIGQQPCGRSIGARGLPRVHPVSSPVAGMEARTTWSMRRTSFCPDRSVHADSPIQSREFWGFHPRHKCMPCCKLLPPSIDTYSIIGGIRNPWSAEQCQTACAAKV